MCDRNGDNINYIRDITVREREFILKNPVSLTEDVIYYFPGEHTSLDKNPTGQPSLVVAGSNALHRILSALPQDLIDPRCRLAPYYGNPVHTPWEPSDADMFVLGQSTHARFKDEKSGTDYVFTKTTTVVQVLLDFDLPCCRAAFSHWGDCWISRECLRCIFTGTLALPNYVSVRNDFRRIVINHPGPTFLGDGSKSYNRIDMFWTRYNKRINKYRQRGFIVTYHPCEVLLPFMAHPFGYSTNLEDDLKYHCLRPQIPQVIVNLKNKGLTPPPRFLSISRLNKKNVGPSEKGVVEDGDLPPLVDDEDSDEEVERFLAKVAKSELGGATAINQTPTNPLSASLGGHSSKVSPRREALRGLVPKNPVPCAIYVDTSVPVSSSPKDSQNIPVQSLGKPTASITCVPSRTQICNAVETQNSAVTCVGTCIAITAPTANTFIGGAETSTTPGGPQEGNTVANPVTTGFYIVSGFREIRMEDYIYLNDLLTKKVHEVSQKFKVTYPALNPFSEVSVKILLAIRNKTLKEACDGVTITLQGTLPFHSEELNASLRIPLRGLPLESRSEELNASLRIPLRGLPLESRSEELKFTVRDGVYNFLNGV
jgi:hypothetical protein